MNLDKEILAEGYTVEIYGKTYLVIRTTGGEFSHTVDGRIVHYSPPNEFTLKRIIK